MKAISTVDQIKALEVPVYVRWSKSIALDNKRGYSLKYGTSQERGLSVCRIDQTWEAWRIVRQLTEYQFCGGSCWIVTGDEVGRGEDNEELLSNVTCLGKVSSELLATNWRKAQVESAIAADEARLTRMTDQIAIEQTLKAIERNRRLLENM